MADEDKAENNSEKEVAMVRLCNYRDENSIAAAGATASQGHSPDPKGS